MCKLAHEEVGAAAEYLLSSQSAFASKLAPTGGAMCTPCGSELAHEGNSPNGPFPEACTGLFANKFAPTGACVLPVGVSLLTKAIAQTAHFPESVPASSRTSSLLRGQCVPLWE
ncbi:hypothetical protein CXB42_24550 [Pseudomonas syringae pv. syringae]|uniref:Uncharacterized protein n=1 Tax=Pseudomonas syringae pv. syringae TaxID=321 RepID=A0AAE5S380_PSESY|nr:hypothetical protein CXB42_24550 [Pseudomonas syringae pv. syringae]